MSKEVLLYSGGPDAHIAYEFLDRPDALYIQHNCKYEFKQLTAVKKIIQKANSKNITVSPTVLDLSVFEELDANIPLRNLYFIMYAVNMRYDKIHIVLQRGEQSIPDRKPTFIEGLSSFLSTLYERNIEINPMFQTMTKQEIVGWYVGNGCDIETLKETVSCFSPIYRMCGQCPACFRRWVAFEYNDIHEVYSNKVEDWIGIREYVKKMKNGQYDAVRSSQTLEVLKKYNLV